jgi:tetraacyldisaccharide 4'-kinase
MRRPVLLPLVPLYAAGSGLGSLCRSLGWPKIRALAHPVISIGNISTGGSGKTPFVIALARLLRAQGFYVDVLSRGYGRKNGPPIRVQLEGNAEEFGDEPLLIARAADVPVYVARQRYQAGRLAETEIKIEREPRVHILDDGFQHRQLYRDIDIVLLDREDWHDHLLPAGNLREEKGSLKRATVLAIPADDREFEKELRETWNGPVWRLCRTMQVPPLQGPVVAFCGVARPGQFLAGLKSAGLSIAGEVIFSDHHRYSIKDVRRLIATADRTNAVALITTEKDQVRLGNIASVFPATLPLKTASLEVQIEEQAAAIVWLEKSLLHSRETRHNQS